MARDSLSEFDQDEPSEETTLPTDEVEEATEELPDEIESADDEGGEEVEQPGDEPEDDRYQALLDRLNEADRRNDELMRMLLKQNEEAQESGPDDEIDPSVEALIDPILRKRIPPEVMEVVQERRRTEQLDQLEQMMPGFKDMWPEVQAEFAKLPPEIAPQFDSMTGALALAGIIKGRNPKKVASKAASQSMKRRAHSEVNATPGRSHSKDLTATDVSEMSPEQFNRLVERLSNGRGRSDDVDPLLR